MKIFVNSHFRKCVVALGVLTIISTVPAFCQAHAKGVSAAELLRQIGIIAIFIALIVLVAVEFFIKKRLTRGTYKWILFLGLFMLPIIAILSSTTTLMEETKTVDSCASCHIMHPFVNDMRNEESATLAARHFKNKWIAEDQCYHCHTSYGIHGTMEAKRDGFRHWLMYVTNTWPEPITFKGSYPNSNCLTCHGETKNFQQVNSHIALREKLGQNEVSCSTCHGPVHPTPLERAIPEAHAAEDEEELAAEEAEAVSNYIQNVTSDNHIQN